MRALVLCAGLGTRLGTLTEHVPKPMLPLDGEPILAHTLRYLARHGFREVAVNLHFLPDRITDHFGDGSAFGVRIHYSYEERLLGTAGAVKKLEPTFFADTEDFLVLYGDIVTDHDLGVLVERHRDTGAIATLVLHRRAGSNSLVAMGDDGRIVDFLERPTEEERAKNPHPWVNSGIQLLNRRILASIPPDRAVDLPRDVFVPLVRRERIHGVPLAGYRVAIDSEERYRQADDAVRKKLVWF
jgi:NDP-sugar pyrophosphorylase family protein